MSDFKRIHHEGHVIVLDPPHGAEVFRRYVQQVVNGGMSEDNFWALMRKENPVLPLQPLRRSIANGIITPAPPKPPVEDLVENSFYWIKEYPDQGWEIAEVKDRLEFARFYVTGSEMEISYREIFALGPRIPDYVPEERAHGHDGERCPLCPDETMLTQMREGNRTARLDKLSAVLADIERDPSAFVFVIEGYDNRDDRMPVIMRVASSRDKALEYVSGVRICGSEIYEVTPHRLDSDRTGEVAMLHFVNVDDVTVERRGGRRDDLDTPQ